MELVKVLQFIFKALFVSSLALNLAFSNSDVKVWRMANKEKFSAELVNYNEEIDQVHLKVGEKVDRYFKLEEFSAVDKAWIIEWLELEELLNNKLVGLGGVFEHIRTEGNYPTDLYIYYPSSYNHDDAEEELSTESEKEEALPAMILFQAGGKALRFAKRHMEAAEATQMTIIACGTFRNRGPEDEYRERFGEVLTTIKETINYNTEKLFIGGISGGAWRAYHYTAWFEGPWAGVYANGGWLGGQAYFDLDYEDGMKVAMVNGNHDHGANHYVEIDSKVLAEHDAEIAIISFEGGHQVPPTSAQIKAFQWLVGSETFEEK